MQVINCFLYSLPGSMAAEMRDWASLTLFMASSISLLDASLLSPGVRLSPAASGFSLKESCRYLLKEQQNSTPTFAGFYKHFLTWGPWTALASGSQQKEPERQIRYTVDIRKWICRRITKSQWGFNSRVHLGVHVWWHSHGSHLFHVGGSKTSKWCPSHLSTNDQSQTVNDCCTVVNSPWSWSSRETHRCQGIGCWKKASSRHHSCHSIGWSQQWHGFGFIWNDSWRKNTISLCARPKHRQTLVEKPPQTNYSVVTSKKIILVSSVILDPWLFFLFFSLSNYVCSLAAING